MANDITGSCEIGESVELIPDAVDDILPPGYLDEGTMAVTGDCAGSSAECPEGSTWGCCAEESPYPPFPIYTVCELVDVPGVESSTFYQQDMPNGELLVYYLFEDNMNIALYDKDFSAAIWTRDPNENASGVIGGYGIMHTPPLIHSDGFIYIVTDKDYTSATTIVYERYLIKINPLDGSTVYRVEVQEGSGFYKPRWYKELIPDLIEDIGGTVGFIDSVSTSGRYGPVICVMNKDTGVVVETRFALKETYSQERYGYQRLDNGNFIIGYPGNPQIVGESAYVRNGLITILSANGTTETVLFDANNVTSGINIGLWWTPGCRMIRVRDKIFAFPDGCGTVNADYTATNFVREINVFDAADGTWIQTLVDPHNGEVDKTGTSVSDSTGFACGFSSYGESILIGRIENDTEIGKVLIYDYETLLFNKNFYFNPPSVPGNRIGVAQANAYAMYALHLETAKLQIQVSICKSI